MLMLMQMRNGWKQLLIMILSFVSVYLHSKIVVMNSQTKLVCLLLTLGAQCSEGYGSWVCVCVCVCLSVKPHLTSAAYVRPEIDVTYSMGNEG